jgi:type VI protein secretion system component VasK
LHTFTCVFLALVFIVCFAVIAVLIYFISAGDFLEFDGEMMFQSLVVVASMLLLLVLGVIALIMWISYFLVKSSASITKIETAKSESPRKRSQSTMSCMQT